MDLGDRRKELAEGPKKVLGWREEIADARREFADRRRELRDSVREVAHGRPGLADCRREGPASRRARLGGPAS
jgi:hypothetical protein